MLINIVHTVHPLAEIKMAKVMWRISERGRGRDEDVCLLQQDAQV